MTNARQIADQLQRAFDGDPWYGSPVVKVLQGVGADDAVARPVSGAHTIWELVLHMTAWKGEVLERLRGRQSREPDEGDWPPMPLASDEAVWRATLKRLREVHTALVGEVKASSEERLLAPVADQRDPALGAGLTQWQTLHGVVQHDVYHTGQIAILKRALERRP